MEGNGDGNSAHEEHEKSAGLTPQVLDYYKRFGKHRDLEQYFSLSTVQGEVRDPVFWRSIKSQPDSDSGKSSAEVCRISINCTVADLSSSSQDGSASDLPEPNSPPIISEDAPLAPTLSPLPEDDREVKSDLDTSHKSVDLNLDSSLTKPHSPTSSINSQRKLEWDSLADVGYPNEHEVRPSASSLSTLERLALHQQFALSDDLKTDDISGHPTAHSTPHEGDNVHSKGKKNCRKGLLKQATKISQRDVEVMEINVDRADNNVVPANINFNLTKHITFNVDPDTGAASVCTNKTSQKTDYLQKCATVTMDAAVGVSEHLDKEIQTSLPRSGSERKEENVPTNTLNMQSRCIATVPVLLNLDLLKRSRHRGLKYYRNKNKKRKRASKQQQTRKKGAEQLEKSIPISEVTIGGNQLSEADSFEYMPAHVYHQNTARNNCDHVSATETSNKTLSSASSGGYTTQSSKFSEHSFNKGLEKSIALLNKLMQLRHEDSNLKKKLVKEVVQKLIKTNYRDDESATEFLSGLSFNSKILDLGNGSSSYHNTTATTTSTSDGNDIDSRKNPRPRKSILCSPKSAKPVHSSMLSEHVVGKTIAQIHSPGHIVGDVKIDPKSSSSSKTGSDKQSNHGKFNSEEPIPKTSSEHLYELYLKALLKEEKYKDHLNSKQEFLKLKLIQKETDQDATSLKTSSLKDLMTELTKNYGSNKGGGDLPPESARSNPERNINGIARKLRSHSVFTISSGNSERKLDDKCSPKIEQKNSMAPQSIKKQKDNLPSKSTDLKFNTLPRNNKNSHYCCCPHHYTKKAEKDNPLHSNFEISAGVRKLSAIYSNDSKDSTSSKENKINQMTATNGTDILSTDLASCNKFVCFCNADGKILDDIPDNFLIYKCCKLPQLAKSGSTNKALSKKSASIQCSSKDFHMDSDQNGYGRKQENKIMNNQILHTVPISNANSKPTVLTATSINVKEKQSVSTTASSLDVVKSVKIGTSKDSSSSERRVLSVPQSSRLNIGLPRRFSDTLFERPKSTLCVDTCMQTSVSIDPKISEPTLADINIIHGNNDGIKMKDDRSYNARYTPIYNFYDHSTEGDSMIDTNAKVTFDKHSLVQNHNHSPKYNQDQFSNRQTETNVPLDTVFHSEFSCVKSIHSSVKSGNEDMMTYRNEKKPNNSIFYAVNTGNEGVITECITQRDVDTSVTGLMKEYSNIDSSTNASINQGGFIDIGVPISHVDVKKASSRPSSHTSIRKSSTSTGVSTEETPQNGEPLLKQQQNLKSPDSSRRAKSIKNGQDLKQDDISYSTGPINKKHEEQISGGKENIANIDFKNKRNKASYPIEHRSTEDSSGSSTMSKEVLLESIKDIIRRYAKKDKPVTIDKRTSRHKYYQEIINKLNFLLRTDGNSDDDEISSVKSLKCPEEVVRNITASKEHTMNVEKKTSVDKSTQHHISSHQNFVCSSTSHHTRKVFISEDSSDLLPSSDMLENSSDSLRYQIFKKIKRECGKFHHKQCECASNFEKLNSRYDPASSSTSINLHKADELHNGHGRCSHRCRSKSSKCSHKKVNKKSIAYNLIIQPADDVILNENLPERDIPPLKDIVVKVPSRQTTVSEKNSQNHSSQHKPQTEFGEFLKSDRFKPQKAHSRREKVFKENENDKSDKQSGVPDDSEISGSSEVRKMKFLTLREYLERNRPDFIANSNERQSCLKVIQESRARQQRVQRALVSLRVVPPRPGDVTAGDVTAGDVTELEALARRLGDELRTRRPSAKFLSEHEMKRHSRRIYRSLPEVLQKKEKHKKDQIKKTNMIIRSLFDKNLQKKALRGTVNISHYSPVIKI